MSRLRQGHGAAFAALLALVASPGATAADDARYSVQQTRVERMADPAVGDRYVVSGGKAVTTSEPRRNGGLVLENSSVLAVATSCDASQGEMVFENGFEQ